MMTYTTKHNTKTLLLFSIILLIATVCFFEFSDLDTHLQNYFFNVDTQHWLINKKSEIPKLIFYDSVKVIYAGSVLVIATLLIFHKKIPTVSTYKEGLLLVVLSSIFIPTLMNVLKAISNMPCPSDINLYGGIYPHVSLLEPYPEFAKPKNNLRCFPAGHASGGFALLSLFFLFKSKRNRLIALFSSLILAWTLGIYKMLIGDHFLSHTLVSFEISLIVILILENLIFKKTSNIYFQ